MLRILLLVEQRKSLSVSILYGKRSFFAKGIENVGKQFVMLYPLSIRVGPICKKIIMRFRKGFDERYALKDGLAVNGLKAKKKKHY